MSKTSKRASTNKCTWVMAVFSSSHFSQPNDITWLRWAESMIVSSKPVTLHIFMKRGMTRQPKKHDKAQRRPPPLVWPMKGNDRYLTQGSRLEPRTAELIRSFAGYGSWWQNTRNSQSITLLQKSCNLYGCNQRSEAMGLIQQIIVSIPWAALNSCTRLRYLAPWQWETGESKSDAALIAGFCRLRQDLIGP